MSDNSMAATKGEVAELCDILKRFIVRQEHFEHSVLELAWEVGRSRGKFPAESAVAVAKEPNTDADISQCPFLVNTKYIAHDDSTMSTGAGLRAYSGSNPGHHVRSFSDNLGSGRSHVNWAMPRVRDRLTFGQPMHCNRARGRPRATRTPQI